MYYLQKDSKIVVADSDWERLRGTIDHLPDFSVADICEGELETGYDGAWYLPGTAPVRPMEETAEEVRQQRNLLLSVTDRYMLADFPIAEDEREQYRQYRQYLRDIPEKAAFPNVSVLTFEEWQNQF